MIVKPITPNAIDRFLEFRSNPIDLNSFHNWIKASHAELLTHLSPGILLKLTRGDTAKVLITISKILPACSNCADICKEGAFANRSEHVSCASRVDLAILDGYLERIKKPSWVGQDNFQLGADAYYKCSSCGSIWTLVEPERQDNGLWERLA